jgi:hypothetical protein
VTHATETGSGDGAETPRASVPTDHDASIVPGSNQTALGLIAAPGVPARLAESLAEHLPAALAVRLPGTAWRAELLEDELVRPPASDADLVAAGREQLLHHDLDLAVVLTDLPLRVRRRPVIAHVSPLHHVALLSVPALGAVAVTRRAEDASLRLIDGLLGEPEDGITRTAASRTGRLTRHARRLAVDSDSGLPTMRLTGRVLTGDLRLLVGMIRANQPGRLVLRLSRALAAASAAGVLALVTSDVWRLADALDPPRLVLDSIGSIAAITVTLVVGAGLWERAATPRTRQQVMLFNVATLATVVIGVSALYIALLLLSLLATGLLLTPALLARGLGHPVHLDAYVRLAWLTASLATVGGALGAGLESDEAVRDAAYTHRTNATTEASRR